MKTVIGEKTLICPLKILTYYNNINVNSPAKYMETCAIAVNFKETMHFFLFQAQH